VRLRELLVASGAPASSIVVSSAGSSTPLATNATPEGRALNRRVEVEVLR
jgi:outer membrane protein OmpA-like peptidoglycan-associated protein